LLNNPFDEELRLITRPFGVLLRAIITTVDERGLKKYHLKKHGKEVDKFFQAIAAHSFRSDAAQSLQTRLVKYRDKLFTFIEHDGVPWNNNNAEHAIKRFAYYREIADGMMSESGLNDYLVLLSINQTCHYKGVSFLKFLLSRKQDIDEFCENPRQKRRAFSLELYPKGFTPPHLSPHRNDKRAQRKSAETAVLETAATDSP
jgi:hypothetical protein